MSGLSIPNGWEAPLSAALASEGMAALARFLEAEQAAGKTIYPERSAWFRALDLTPLDQARVVILGQDPYHGPGQAHGLCFSVNDGVDFPPSLRNIYKELHNDTNVHAFTSIPTHGNLERWAKQGVLLLNNVLTVRRGEAASHAKRGWEEFTDKVIKIPLDIGFNKIEILATSEGQFRPNSGAFTLFDNFKKEVFSDFWMLAKGAKVIAHIIRIK